MKTNDVFPSKYLKAEDDLFANGDVTATIKDVTMESLESREKGKEQKALMTFKELPKGLLLNKTNWGVCEKLFSSDDSDAWVGEKVILTTVEVDAFGDVVKAIRIKAQKPAVDRQALMGRYTKLYQRGVAAKLEGIENYVIAPTMADDEIIAIGRELKAKVEAAEQF